MFCHKCGRKVENDDVFCMSCGAKIIRESVGDENVYSSQTTYTQPMYQPQGVDLESTGLNIISFMFPLIGAILYLVLKDDKPRKAKACGKWALISVITSVGLVVFFFLTMFFIFITRI